ncbi:U-box domain-containing protein 39-like [Hordeum vulgare]|nr:U-box domain-containing protein 39-like [Hordeum vulgare]
MAIYHLLLAAVNQSKVARFPGASKALLSIASSAAKPTPIRRLALMDVAELEEWCVAAIYALSRDSLRFRGLAHAAGADKALRRVAEEGTPGGVRA